MKDFSELLTQLVNGKIDFLEVKPEEFPNFQDVLMDFPERKQIIGTAHRGGAITYKYENGNSN